MLSKNINLIVACQSKDYGISANGQIPWDSPIDMKHFKDTTRITKSPNLKNAIVMGRKTFDSIGRPLPNRINYVVTRNQSLLSKQDSDRLYYVNSLDIALQQATANTLVEKVFVVGGAEIYNQTLRDWGKYIDTSFVTEIHSNYKCDCHVDSELFKKNHYPAINGITKTDKNELKIIFTEYKGRNVGEEEYLNLMTRILENGDLRQNRTGIDTISIFGERMVFDISERIPFLTTKRLAWKTMLRELLWFISGDTNNKTLQDKKVRIWNGNSTREYFDSIGLTEREVGDLGPVYGHQWRHFGSDYTDCHTDYTGQGVDQLAEVIRQIKETPDSRRIIMSAWNPKDQPKMALPPCHLMAQWYVRKGKYLDCQMYQRSCDVALGVPFNIASYSILTYMIAHVCGLQPGMYTHILGDAHIYSNHVSSVKEQLTRTPHQFPSLRFARTVDSIDNFTEQDFIIENYKCHPSIKMDMAV